MDAPVLADDGGLELAAFPKLLGVKTQRFFKSQDPHQQNQQLLALFAENPQASRNFSLHAALIYHKNQTSFQAEAELNGTITQPQGTGGYGFDPILFLPEKQKTCAQWSQKERLLLSPRVQAFKKLLTMEVFQ